MPRQRSSTDDPVVQMNVRIPKSLRDRIDARRGTKDMSRDLWVTNALRFALDNAGRGAPVTPPGGPRTAPPPRHR